MNKAPLMQIRPAVFGAKTSSADYNASQEEMFYDLWRLFQDADALKEVLAGNKEHGALENQFLQLRVSRLEHELQDQLDQLRAHEVRHSLEAIATGKPAPPVNMTLWPEQMIAPPSPLPGAQVSTFYGHISLLPAGNVVSKLTLTDSVTGEIVIPKALAVKFNPPADDLSTDANWQGPFDGKPETAWLRTVRVPASDPTQDVSCEIVVGLPDSIISSRDVNTIVVHPYPFGSVDVMNVEWRLDGPFKSIPGWEGPILDAPPLRLAFPTCQVAELKITLRQRHAIEQMGEKLFYLGAQSIEAADVQVGQATASVDAIVELPGAGKRSITAIAPVLQGASALSDRTADKRSLVSFAVYEIDDQGVERYTRDQFPVLISTPKVRIRTTIYKDRDNGVSPTLEAVRVSYLPGVS